MLPPILFISKYFWLVFYFLKVRLLYFEFSQRSHITERNSGAPCLKGLRTGVREQGAAETRVELGSVGQIV